MIILLWASKFGTAKIECSFGGTIFLLVMVHIKYLVDKISLPEGRGVEVKNSKIYIHNF